MPSFRRFTTARGGLTLIEILFVAIVLGGLMHLLVIPAVQWQLARRDIGRVERSADWLFTAQRRAWLATGRFTTSLPSLGVPRDRQTVDSAHIFYADSARWTGVVTFRWERRRASCDLEMVVLDGGTRWAWSRRDCRAGA